MIGIFKFNMTKKIRQSSQVWWSTPVISSWEAEVKGLVQGLPGQKLETVSQQKHLGVWLNGRALA
jgi:hypothetical protein